MLDPEADFESKVRGLPQVQRLLELPQCQVLFARFSRTEVIAGLRCALSEARAQLKASGATTPTYDDLLIRAEEITTASRSAGLRRVINATGVILHTNLGRAPLAAEALEAMVEAGQGYCNLEIDLVSGSRGSRLQAVEPLLQALTGAPAGMAVNNAAAAVLLALSALARGGEVIVSRGELVEIGGGFRIPDVIAQGGARLVEVGTTNKTSLSDYRDAITPATRMLLKVHQSNFRIVGFTAEADLAALAGLAREHALWLMHDLGGGALLDFPQVGKPGEPTVQGSLKAGADIVAFSGDKLMGGPQAGLLVGGRDALQPLRSHPLMRALRLDKLTLAALEATLRLYHDRDQAVARVPSLRMLAQTDLQLQGRAEALAVLLAGVGEVCVEPSDGYAGAGASPQSVISSRAVTLRSDTIAVDEMARRLRQGRPAVVARVSGGVLVLDLLAVSDDELESVACAVRAALA